MNRLSVGLRFSDAALDVGLLVLEKGEVYFKYSADFLATGLDISPFHLRRTSAIQRPNTQLLDGLFGVFADSLPDGWGRLLQDRVLASKGIDLSSITALDRLAFVGENGPGALTYRPAQPLDNKVQRSIELDTLAVAAQDILAGNSNDVIDQLVKLGGSSGGARPKVVVSYQPEENVLSTETSKLPPGYEHWLIKFPATVDPLDIAQIELGYHFMAIDAGLEMMPCRLFQGRSGRSYFGTKRFDRLGDNRLHLHSIAGLLHNDFRYTNVDYGHVMDAAVRLEKDRSAAVKVLRLAAFNVFANNRDDHNKNISFLMDAAGQWRFAPVYDLTFAQSTHGYHSMSVAGESRSPGREDLLRLAKSFSISNANSIIEEVRAAVNRWPEHADQAGLKKATAQRIAKGHKS
ncbi:MAG: type II toxin-antitoxin system HipA family toxin [Bacteroidota bacterium]